MLFNISHIFVYSMFVLMKGRTKDEAFKIGHEIAKKVTEMFPKPMKLKFEKVSTWLCYRMVYVIQYLTFLWVTYKSAIAIPNLQKTCYSLFCIIFFKNNFEVLPPCIIKTTYRFWNCVLCEL